MPNKIAVQSNVITELVSDLGGDIGQGIFNLLLGLLGLFVVWRIKKQLVGYICLILLFLFSFYDTNVNIYLSFIAAIFAGYGFISLIDMKWKLDLIKKIYILKD